MLRVVLEDYAGHAETSTRTYVVDEDGGSCILVEPATMELDRRALRLFPNLGTFPTIPEFFDDVPPRLDISTCDPRDGRFDFAPPAREDLSGSVEQRRTMEKHAPEAVAWLTFAAPSYTDDGELALVRFTICPSYHGVLASWLLCNEDGQWHVVAKHILHTM